MAQRLIMFSLRKNSTHAGDLLSSTLFDQNTFYKAFYRDLAMCSTEAIIESPFITSSRMAHLLPIFIKMRGRGVSIIVNTRHPSEHDAPFAAQAGMAIEQFQAIGAQVLLTGGHHRKLAILDRRVLWEGSLNILSQNDSCEMMRRTVSETLAAQMLCFTKVDRFVR